MDNDDDLYVLKATSPGGTVIRFGPVDIATGVLLVDRDLAPRGWTPVFHRVTAVDGSVDDVLRPTSSRYQVHGADVFVALRRAIRTDPTFDGADCPRGGALIAHLEAHRPMAMYLGEEECRLAECVCPRDADGICSGMTLASLICGRCSAVYDPGGEWGPDWLDEARITWPCPVIQQVAARYHITITDKGAVIHDA